MNDTDQGQFIEILERCLAIDQMAIRLYWGVHKSGALAEFGDFAERMSAEERSHARAWKELLKLARAGAVPPLLDDLPETLEYIREACGKVAAIIASRGELASSDLAVAQCFMIELTMLHPAFETMFEYLARITPGLTIDYDTHLRRFIDILRKTEKWHARMMMGEALEMLWVHSRLLSKRSQFDTLTNVLNRKGILSAMRGMAFLSQRTGSLAGVLMLDIDHFKNVNDTYGHGKGDEVLAGVAKGISQTVRQSDLVGRFGGEEFVVFLCPVTADGVAVVAEKIRREVESSQPGGILVTVSVGAAFAKAGVTPEQDLDRLLRLADERLYQAKEGGRNRVVAV